MFADNFMLKAAGATFPFSEVAQERTGADGGQLAVGETPTTGVLIEPKSPYCFDNAIVRSSALPKPLSDSLNAAS